MPLSTPSVGRGRWRNCHRPREVVNGALDRHLAELSRPGGGFELRSGSLLDR